MTDIHDILAERGSRYGDFADVAEVAVDLRAAIMRAAGDGAKWSPSQGEAIVQITTKLARIACGDPDYPDSWRDIAGYATLVADRLDRGAVNAD